MRKAIFFDIDGTLWDVRNRIPDSTVRAIRELKAGGNPVFVCSGRTRGYITDPYLLSLGFDGIVSGCGTMVEYRNDVRFYHKIDSELAVLAVDTVRRYGMRPILEGREYLYMERSEFQDDPYGKKLFRELKDRARPIDALRGKWEISKLSCATEGCDTSSCFRELEGYFDYIVHNPRVTEMVPKGFDKGRGLIRACGIAGIPPSESIAFGDSVNDLQMFAAAGLSVCMGNGSEEAKAAADMITDSLFDDGIYNAVKTLGLI
ncbi:MAG: HAD family hydrolase [Clostridiales bacterium]|nr:HAD family hydrolase [Clostridiales bacterium]